MSLPFSQACENNKVPILEKLVPLLKEAEHVLEVGSGTGQHGVFFAKSMPWLVWQPSDQLPYIEGLKARIKAEGSPNLLAPIVLDVAMRPWPVATADNIFTANSLHIMSMSHVEDFFQGVQTVLKASGKLMIYGPFKYEGHFTTSSNARFDLWLKEKDPLSGIRDTEWILQLAQKAGCQLLHDFSMPANNQLLVFLKN